MKRLGTGELVRRLINNLSDLVDREVDLVRQEARVDAIHLASGAVALVIGLMFLYTMLAALIVAAIMAVIGAVNPLSPPAVSALIVAGVFLVLGGILGAFGWSRFKMRVLERTRETVREDVQWLRRQVR